MTPKKYEDKPTVVKIHRHLVVIVLIKLKKKKHSVTSEKYLPFTSFLIIFQTGVKYTLALYKNIIRVQSSEIHLLTGNNLKI